MQMRCLPQCEEHFGLFNRAGKEMDEDMKKEKEIKVKRGSVKEGRILMNEWIYSVYIAKTVDI